jgi:hypothetical protein
MSVFTFCTQQKAVSLSHKATMNRVAIRLLDQCGPAKLLVFDQATSTFDGFVEKACEKLGIAHQKCELYLGQSRDIIVEDVHEIRNDDTISLDICKPCKSGLVLMDEMSGSPSARHITSSDSTITESPNESKTPLTSNSQLIPSDHCISAVQFGQKKISITTPVEDWAEEIQRGVGELNRALDSMPPSNMCETSVVIKSSDGCDSKCEAASESSSDSDISDGDDDEIKKCTKSKGQNGVKRRIEVSSDDEDDPSESESEPNSDSDSDSSDDEDEHSDDSDSSEDDCSDDSYDEGAQADDYNEDVWGGSARKKAREKKAMEQLPQVYGFMNPEDIPLAPGDPGQGSGELESHCDVIDTSTDNLAREKAKIAKMLQLGLHPSTSEAEAQQAMKRAQKLLTKFNLTQAAVLTSTDNSQGSAGSQDIAGLQGGMVCVYVRRRLKGDAFKPAVLNTWMHSLASAIGENFKVKYFYESHSGSVTFYGLKTNSQLAAYAFKISVDKISIMRNKFTPPEGEYERKYRLGQTVIESKVCTAQSYLNMANVIVHAGKLHAILQTQLLRRNRFWTAQICEKQSSSRRT